MNEDIIRLIHQDVDLMLEGTDRQRLDAALHADPVAAALHADLIHLAGALRALSNPAVPPQFTRRVMERIPVATRRAPSALRSWLNAFRTAFAPRTAFAFALGCLLTIVAVGALDLADMEETGSAAGTMTREPIPAGSIEIIQSSASTRVALRFAAPVESIEIDLASENPAVLDLQVNTSTGATFHETVPIGSPVR